MNDQDKEAFEKWRLQYISTHTGYFKMAGTDDLAQVAWQAACEYKQKEIEEKLNKVFKDARQEMDYRDKKITFLEGECKRLYHPIREFWNMDKDEEMKKLQADNIKLRECVEWYADRKNCDNADFCHVEIDELGEEIADGGYRARRVLKELEEK